jgi:pyruvate-formate lyase-activating enzyme
VGEEKSVEVMKVVLQDKIFMRPQWRGHIGGGDPLLQAEAAEELPQLSRLWYQYGDGDFGFCS